MKLTVLMCFLSLRVTANHSGGVTLLGKTTGGGSDSA